jgi:hypothetical protein
MFDWSPLNTLRIRRKKLITFLSGGEDRHTLHSIMAMYCIQIYKEITNILNKLVLNQT